MAFAIMGLLTGCTGMQNYLSGRTFSGDPIVRSGLLVIENLAGQAILQIWVRDENLSEWRHVAGLAASLEVPVVEPGQTYRMSLSEGANDVKLIHQGGAETTKRVYMTPAGARWTIGPERKPARVAAAPDVPAAPSPTPAMKPEKPAPVAIARRASGAAEPLEGLYATAKETNRHYKNRTWKTLNLKGDGRASWRWMNDFKNTVLARPSDACYWEATQFEMSYTTNGDNTLELRCLDRKQLFCDGEVKQRACFSHSVPVRVTEDGIYVDNGDNDGLYTRQ